VRLTLLDLKFKSLSIAFFFRSAKALYQLQTMVEYKAKLLGVPIAYIDPAYTFQTCSRCDHIGNRNSKSFECLTCGHVEHADVNAAFNIALSQT